MFGQQNKYCNYLNDLSFILTILSLFIKYLLFMNLYKHFFLIPHLLMFIIKTYTVKKLYITNIQAYNVACTNFLSCNNVIGKVQNVFYYRYSYSHVMSPKSYISG